MKYKKKRVYKHIRSAKVIVCIGALVVFGWLR